MAEGSDAIRAWRARWRLYPAAGDRSRATARLFLEHCGEGRRFAERSIVRLAGAGLRAAMRDGGGVSGWVR